MCAGGSRGLRVAGEHAAEVAEEVAGGFALDAAAAPADVAWGSGGICALAEGADGVGGGGCCAAGGERARCWAAARGARCAWGADCAAGGDAGAGGAAEGSDGFGCDAGEAVELRRVSKYSAV